LNGLGFQYQSEGVVVGADYKILPRLAMGIAGGYEYSILDPRFVSGLGSANSVTALCLPHTEDRVVSMQK
jgi:hypothetical protein